MGNDAALRRLMDAIATGDEAAIHQALAPGLATATLGQGATREAASENFLTAIGHHVYAGDTALHVAAAAHRPGIARMLLALGADVAARNRRGATPLHYAADGSPGEPRWDPVGQVATIGALLAVGAEPDALDRSGVAPLHRAVRTRSAAAVAALLDAGADPRRPNGNGSTPLMLATLTTGRSGSGTPVARAQQAEIVDLLARHGMAP